MATAVTVPPSIARARRVGEGWQAALLLAALLTITHYDVIFLGRSLISTNYSNPLDWRAIPDNYGPRLVPHTEWTSRNLWPYGNIRDAGATWWQWEPSTQYLKHAIQEREWPFWDPYIAWGGTPAMSNLVPAFFFPPYLIVVLLGAPVALLNAYFLFLIWCPAFFTFLFVRRHDVGFWPSLAAGVAVMLGGTVHQHAGTFIGQTAACLPFVLYATRRFFDEPTVGRAAAMALAYAIAALASFPPVLLSMFGAAAIYGIVAIAVESRGARLRVTALWGVALALSLGLVAFYYLPALATRAAATQMADAYAQAGLESMPLRNLFQIVSPTLMGGVPTYLQAPVRSAGAYLPYIGIMPVALALVATVAGSRRRRTLAIAFGLTLTALLLKLTGSPVVQWVGTLPMLKEIHIAQYFGMPVGFLVASLGALGLHALLAGTVTPARALVAAMAAVAVPEALWRVGSTLNVFKSPAASYWLRDWWILAVVALAGGIAILVASLIRDRPRPRTIAVAIVMALLAADGIYMGWWPNPSAWSIFDHPVPFIRTLQRETQDRTFTVGAPNANLSSAFRIFLTDSLMAFNPPRIYRLYFRYTQAPGQAFMRDPLLLPPEPVLDRGNIGVVGVNLAFTNFVRSAAERGYKTIFDDGFIALYKRPTLPRFWFSSEYRIVSAAAALEEIASAKTSEILLEQDPGVPYASNAASDPQVTIESYRLNSVRVAVDAPRPGLLYASEAFFDGWSARVNGASTPILAANYAFRAVPIPAGRVRVEFDYWPPGLDAGLAITALSVAGVIALAFAGRLRPSARSASEPRTRSAAP